MHNPQAETGIGPWGPSVEIPIYVSPVPEFFYVRQFLYHFRAKVRATEAFMELCGPKFEPLDLSKQRSSQHMCAFKETATHNDVLVRTRHMRDAIPAEPLYLLKRQIKDEEMVFRPLGLTIARIRGQDLWLTIIFDRRDGQWEIDAKLKEDIKCFPKGAFLLTP
jgi:hypothetical protein